MGFDVAIYTDVVASEAVDRVDGFNFQAVSPGITGVDQRHIRESLLHRVVPTWSLAHDPLEHPATCAYSVHEGRRYLARGASTGATNSGRPGNQLTQVIVTSDADDLVPYRPAQLYGATAWTLAKAASTEVPEWIAPLGISPDFEVAALEALVRDDDWATSVLPHLLTMLDEAVADEPKKLVLLHADLDVVMRWIALGSLFLETDVARALTFRALVDDPWRVDAAVVGVSPEFEAGDLSAANVLDLSARATPTIEPSPAARVRAGWFVEHGADDALHATEVAQRWTAALGADLAHDAARVVGLPDGDGGAAAWRTAMAAVCGLVEAGLVEDLSLYADELCDAAVGHQPVTAEEIGLAGRAIRAAHDLAVEDVATGILLPTLEAVAADPQGIRALAAELAAAATPVEWSSDDARRAAGAFVGAALAELPVELLPDALATAWSVAGDVPAPMLDRAVGELSAAWAREPGLGRERWRRWYAGRAVLERTCAALLEAFRAGEEDALTSLLRGEWDLLDRLTEDAELRGWLAAGRLGRSPVDSRRSQIATARAVPSDAWRVVLAESTLPRHSELWSAWILNHGLDAELAGVIMGKLEETFQLGPGRVDVAHTDWHPLLDPSRRAPHEELARVASDYERGRKVLGTVRREVMLRSDALLHESLPYVESLAPLYLSEIGWILLFSANLDEVERLIEAATTWVAPSVPAAVYRMIASDNGVPALHAALHARSHLLAEVASAADDAVVRVVAAHPRLIEQAQADPRVQKDLDAYLRGQQGERKAWLRPGSRTRRSEES